MTTPTLETLRAHLLAAMGGPERFEQLFASRSFRSGRHVHELDAADASAAAAFKAIAAGCEERGRPDLVPELQALWLARFVRLWIAYQHAGARTANWAVVGPARFPVARNEKRMQAEDRRRAEMLDHVKRARFHAERRAAALNRQQTSPTDRAANELDDARRRLAQREERQAMMRKANELARQVKGGSDDDRAARFAELMKLAGLPVSLATAAQLLRPNYMGRVAPFESYQLSNNSAEIRRLSGRVAELERKAAAVAVAVAAEEAPAAVQIGAAEVLENVAADRLQLRFEGKPPAATIQRLKARGFRWSPTEGAWQRQLTNSARDAARWVLTAQQ